MTIRGSMKERAIGEKNRRQRDHKKPTEAQRLEAWLRLGLQTQGDGGRGE